MTDPVADAIVAKMYSDEETTEVEVLRLVLLELMNAEALNLFKSTTRSGVDQYHLVVPGIASLPLTKEQYAVVHTIWDEVTR